MADQNDAKTPIKWQIIKQDGDDLFLLADQVLDCKPYNEEYTSVTWERAEMTQQTDCSFALGNRQSRLWLIEKIKEIVEKRLEELTVIDYEKVA